MKAVKLTDESVALLLELCRLGDADAIRLLNSASLDVTGVSDEHIKRMLPWLMIFDYELLRRCAAAACE